MSNPCGKSCDPCPVRKTAHCTGCEDLRAARGCAVADCCRAKNLDCTACAGSADCSMRQTMLAIHTRRTEKAEQELCFREKAIPLSRWLTALFWIMIAGEIVGLATSETLVDHFRWYPITQTAALFLQTLRNFVPAFILWKLRSTEVLYRRPAILTGIDAFLTAVLSLLEDFILPDTSAGTVLLFLLSLPNIALRCYTTYLLYGTHAQTLDYADAALADRWQKLRKWSIAMWITAACTPFLIVFGNIAVLAAFVSVIGNVITRILGLIYLYRTAKIFRTLAGSPLDK